MGDDQQAAGTQDSLRPLRMFVGALQGALGSDQSMAGADGTVYNPPGQFTVVGSYGAGQSVEGQPIITTPGAFGLPRWVVWAALGALAYKFAKA